MIRLILLCSALAACSSSAPSADPLDQMIADDVAANSALGRRVSALESRLDAMGNSSRVIVVPSQEAPSQMGARERLVEHAKRKELEGRVDALEAKRR